jgi:hypothetical protein
MKIACAFDFYSSLSHDTMVSQVEHQLDSTGSTSGGLAEYDQPDRSQSANSMSRLLECLGSPALWACIFLETTRLPATILRVAHFYYMRESEDNDAAV